MATGRKWSGRGKAGVKTISMLHDTEEAVRELFDNMGSGVAIYEPVRNGRDFVFRDINKAGERISNVRKGDVVGKSVVKVFPSIKKMGLFGVFQSVWRTGKPRRHPVSLYEDRRLSQWVENYVYRLPLGYIVAVYDDVTDGKLAEEKILKRDARIEALFEAIPDMIFIFNGAGVFTGFKPVKKYREYSFPAHFLGKRVSRVFPRDVGRKFMSHIRGALESGLERVFEYRLRQGSELVYFEARFVVSGVDEVLAIVRDVTERRRVEDELRFAAELLDSATDSIFLHDLDGNFVYVNQTACKLRGYSREELLSMNLHDLDVPEYAKKIKSHMRGLVRCGEAIFETAQYRKDGSVLPMEVHSKIIERDGVKLVLSVSRDITDRKIIEELLEKSRKDFKGLS